MPTYRAIQLMGKGGLDQLQEVELPLAAPQKGELRIRVRASGVASTDLMKRQR
jgi:NADPH:quinone reductase-like Zn-dependent oxidoreductase